MEFDVCKLKVTSSSSTEDIRPGLRQRMLEGVVVVEMLLSREGRGVNKDVGVVGDAATPASKGNPLVGLEMRTPIEVSLGLQCSEVVWALLPECHCG